MMNADLSNSFSECTLSLENTIMNMVNQLLDDKNETNLLNETRVSISSSNSVSFYFDSEHKSSSPANENEKHFSQKQSLSPFNLSNSNEYNLNTNRNSISPNHYWYDNIFNSNNSHINNNNIHHNVNYPNTIKINTNKSDDETQSIPSNDSTDNSSRSIINNNSYEQSQNYIDYLLYEISPLLIRYDKIDMGIYQKLQGNFVNIIKSQKGSRILQNFLKKTPSNIIQLIFQEIKSSTYDIISNFYGNYFFKKFFKCLRKKDRIEVISIIKSEFVTLSFDNVGTFPIQGIIEQANSTYEKKLILQIIKPYIKEYCSHQYGSHVIEKIIMCFGNEHTSFIFDYILNNFLELSKDACSICVIKAMIRYLTNKTNNLYKRTFNILLQNMKKIVFNQFGNQVIQTVIQFWDCNQLGDLILLLQSDFVDLSIGKYSSTVIEAFIEKNVYLLSVYIKEISKKNQMIQIMKNCYGNYVIQKALKISTNHSRKFLIEYIKKNVYKLNDQKLINKWLDIIEHYVSLETQTSSTSNNY